MNTKEGGFRRSRGLRALFGVAVFAAAVQLSGADRPTPAAAAPFAPDAALRALALDSRGGLELQRRPGAGPFHVTGRIPFSRFTRARSASARGRDFWAAYGTAFGVRDPDTQLTFGRVTTDRLGRTHIRYGQRHRGLAVFGRQLILHLDEDEVIAVNGEFEAGVGVDTVPDLGARAARDRAARTLRHLGGRAGLDPELLVYPDSARGARLAWQVSVPTTRPLGSWRVFVDAETGGVLSSYDNFHAALSRRTHDADGSFTLPGTLVRAETATPSGEAVVDGTHDKTGLAYGYFNTTFGRDSYDGLGHLIRSSVHVGTNFDSAGWCPASCVTNVGATGGEQLIYGDGTGGATGFSPLGLDSDVVTHEYTHAVTEYATSSTEEPEGLIYRGQSGALNEALSDTFAAFRDSDGRRWEIAEDSWTPSVAGDALRNIANPALGADPQPGHMNDYIETAQDNEGVHVNSGIPARAAYLIAEGPDGIGLAATEQLYYCALTSWIFPTADFAASLAALRMCAADEADEAAVVRAHAAVGIVSPPTVLVPGEGDVLEADVPTSVEWEPNGDAGLAYRVEAVPETAPVAYEQPFAAATLPPGFENSGDASWAVDQSMGVGGTSSLKAGSIGDDGRSELSYITRVATGGVVSFKFWVSSEFSDHFGFYVDGVLQGLPASGPSLEWEAMSVDLGPGVHRLAFVYEKDGDGSAGDDSAWIDDLTITGTDAAVPMTIAASTAVAATSQPWTPHALGDFRVRVTTLGAVAPWLASDDSGTFAVASDVPPALSIGDAQVTEGDAGTAPMTFAVTLDRAAGETVTVDYATTEGSACCDEDPDFVETAGTLTFDADDVSKTISVPVNGDDVGELHEDFFLTLSGATPNVTVAGGSARGLILNDDGTCTYDQGTRTVHLPVDTAERSLFVEDGWINADNASCGTADVVNTNTISVTGGTGEDTLIVDLKGGEPFSPGFEDELEGSEIEIVVDLEGGNDSLIVGGSEGPDDLAVGADGINLNPGDEAADPDPDIAILGTLGTLAVTGNLGDDMLSGAGGSGTGAPSSRNLTLSGNEGDDSLTGGSGADAIIGGADDDTLVGAGGVDTVDFSGTEGSVQVDLAAGIATGAGSDTLAGIENVTGADFDDVLAGDSGANVLDGGLGDDTADFSAAAGGVVVNLATAPGTATGDGNDTLAGIESVTGSAQPDTIDGNDFANRLEGGGGADTVRGGGGADALAMQDGFADTLVSCGAGDDVAQIDADVDPEPLDCETLEQRTVSIQDAPAVVEGNSGTTNATFLVQLSEVATTPVTVGYTTVDGSALEAQDYVAKTDVVTIPAGVSSAPVTVAVVGDTADEPAEAFGVLLDHPSGAGLDDAEGLATITDDDAPPTVSLGRDVSVDEGEPAVFDVTLDAPSGRDVTVQVAAVDDTAQAPADYSVPAPEVEIPAGATSAEVVIPTTDDGDDETDETFTIGLSAPENAVLGEAQAVGTITNNDDPTIVLDHDQTVGEGDTAQFMVGLSHESLEPVTVHVATRDLEATAPGDYVQMGEEITIPAGGTTVSIATVDDATDEPDESFAVDLSDPQNAILDIATVTGTIADNDAADPQLIATVGTNNAFVISLKHPDGTPVTVLAPGRYDITVHDQSQFHNFRLFRHGGATIRSTTVGEVGTFQWNDIELPAGEYGYECEPHNHDMHGTFSVGNRPVAVNDAYSVAEDATLTVNTPSGVLANDTDADLQPLAAALVGNVSHGLLALNSNGSFTYTPASDFAGTDTFTYRASDGALSSNVATVTITVNGANDAPVAQSQAATTGEDTPRAITLAATDVDTPPASLTYTVVEQPTHGVLSGTAPNLTYTPAGNYFGPDSFTFRARDGSLDSNVATVSITVNAVNDRPVAQAQSVTTDEDTARGITLVATDVETASSALTYTVVDHPAHGVLSGTGSNLTYTPAGNYHGSDSFTFTASDGALESTAATVSFAVTAINDRPVAAADSYSTPESTALAIAAPGLIANDTDIDTPAASLTALKVSDPGHGSVTVSPNGSFSYTPTTGYTGLDSFTYKTNDGALDSTAATVTIDVGAVNDAPVAQGQSVTTAEETAKPITLAASDVDSTSLTYTVIDAPDHGALSGTAPNLTYTPAANYSGPDSFTFKANDGALDSNVATVTINVTPVNDPPAAANDAYSVDEDATLTVPLAQSVLGNDSDIDSAALTAVKVADPANGVLTLNANGTFTYTPTPNYSGPDSFTYKVNDGALDSNVATVTIAVTAVNDAPVAVDDAYGTGQDTPLTVGTPAVLGNDSDVDSAALVAVQIGTPANGAATLNPDGSFTYTPNAGFSGTDSFTYRASDGVLQSNLATVTITVAQAPPPPPPPPAPPPPAPAPPPPPPPPSPPSPPAPRPVKKVVKKVTLCFRKRTIKVAKKQVARYKKKGAKLGACKKPKKKRR